MTRKCVLCKGTNYKNTYSFFSAPKDPETRKKWKAVIPIKNYEVTDDTYVCSKHFQKDDIITHWVSGVPPHVVTIKYKKCRLRPGAVPDITLNNKNEEEADESEDTFDTFQINRNGNTSFEKSHSEATMEKKQMFSITREGNGGISGTLSNRRMGQDDDMDYQLEYNTNDSAEMDAEGKEEEEEEEEDYRKNFVWINENGKTIIGGHENAQQVVYVGFDQNVTDVFLVESTNGENCKDQMDDNQDGDEPTNVEYLEKSTEDEASMEVWNVSENKSDGDSNQRKYEGAFKSEKELLEVLEQDSEDVQEGQVYGKNSQSSAYMLFEDLLEVFTEVALPQGWSCMVTSKGHATTIAYLSMGLTNTGIPYVEKQVFVNSDMILRCTAADKEINPFIHNLVHDSKSLTVRSSSDIEELLEEFNQRIICEGSTSLQDNEEWSVPITYHEGVKWRHKECSILINNGSTTCSKCLTLSNACIKYRRNEKSKSLIRKDRKIYALEQMLKKMIRRNEQFELMKTSYKDKLNMLLSEPQNILKTCVESLNMPKIQKLMVKECLKASNFDSEEKTRRRYSETWVFLALLLYTESPRMYKYLMLNHYMILPSLRIIKKYLRQIKTDQQFHKLFLRTVERYHEDEDDDEKEPT